jgi:hypothetical protein
LKHYQNLFENVFRKRRLILLIVFECLVFVSSSFIIPCTHTATMRNRHYGVSIKLRLHEFRIFPSSYWWWWSQSWSFACRKLCSLETIATFKNYHIQMILFYSFWICKSNEKRLHRFFHFFQQHRMQNIFNVTVLPFGSKVWILPSLFVFWTHHSWMK